MMGVDVDLLDDVLVVAGIAWLIVRQFQWRDAARMPRIGLILIALGAVLLVQETLTSTARWSALDAAVLAGEIVVTAALGAVMGTRYRLRPAGTAVQARLAGSGVALWALFVLLRLGSFALAHALGADLVRTSGALLLVFGANRLVTGLIVQRRTAGLPGAPATA